MKRYVARRLLQLVPILLGITLLSFGMMRLAGGDAVTALIENQGAAVSQDVIDQKKAALGLDKPFLVQYANWLGGFLTGNMGDSYVSGKPVFDTFASKLPATLLLTLSSVVCTVLVAVPLGIYSATHRNRASDYIIRFGSFVGNALPNFFVALLLILVFAVWLGWLPVISSPLGQSGIGAIRPIGLVLPTATLTIAMVGKYTRQVRATVLDELGKRYVDGARSRGIPERRILYGSVLRSSMIMIVTMLALSIGDLLGGAAIVESIFQWDGVGKLAVDSIALRDYPIIQAYVVWMAVIYVVVNLVADLAYRALDPRVRIDGEGA
ncbi:nickel transporter permease NikB [Berryella intestinalis]|uniref:Nickel transporter permease NikB n=1 Tax=Berryella intestinalis TaxID=1531429 RepID=A0A0A8B227_9ACTN|nr:ABC transporter permease [Berryella intestinalis]AJC11429.1 nickel transporter permease NikB [Berryella intestinalis]